VRGGGAGLREGKLKTPRVADEILFDVPEVISHHTALLYR